VADRPLFEGDANAVVATPNGMTAAHELIGFDDQGE
jgi:hypothetical protein